MQAIILVGGLGTRLRPLTCYTPKAIVPIINIPFLKHLLSYLKKHNIKNVVLAMGYNPAPIRQALNSGIIQDMELTYVIEDRQLGTAGAVKNAEKYLEDEFFVFNGDVLTEIDLGEMLEKHRKSNADVSIALTPVDNPTIYGVVETAKNDIITNFIEKPSPDRVTTNNINAGIYILRKSVISRIPPGTYYMFENQVFPDLLRSDKIMLAYKSEAYWIDIGSHEKYKKANFDLLKKMSQEITSGENCNISPDVKISPPCLIGNHCTIKSGAILNGPLILGDNCTIEEDSVISSSILWEHVLTGRQSSVNNSIIGSYSKIGSYNKLENCIIGEHITVAPHSNIDSGALIWPPDWKE